MEAGMSFGGFIRAMRDRAAERVDPKLDAKRDRLLMQFYRYYLAKTRTTQPVSPDSQRTNMIYDPGPSR